MRAWRLVCQLGIMGGLVAAAIHCGSDNGSAFGDPATTAACNSAFAGRCGVACADDNACGAGLYCSASKVCTADCAPSVACENAGQCTTNGQCVTGGTIGDRDGSTVLPDGAVILADGAVCASTNVNLAKTEPYVLFVLDQSGSMEAEKFPTEANGNPTRLQALKNALVGASGTDTNSLISKLQGNAQVAYGFYSATSTNNGASYLNNGAAACPRFNGGKTYANAFDGGLQFSDSNYAQLAAAIRATSADEDTPTGEAIQALVGLNDTGTVTNPSGFAAYDAGAAPKIIILVTDGQAGSCTSASVSTPATTPAQVTAGFQKTLAVVKSVKAQNISTYYIFIGRPDQTDPARTKQIANAGVGQDPNAGDASAFLPTDAQKLADTLNSIVTNARSCNFALDGEVTTDGSSGTVLVNGKVVPFGSGWRLADKAHIELLGATCDEIKNNPSATLSASFPCGVVVPPGGIK